MKVRAHTTIKGCDSKIEQGHFNGGEHLFLEIDGQTHQTVSCILPNGKFVTFAFVPGQEGQVECVDIHTTAGEQFKYKPSDSDTHYSQKLIGFSRAGDTFDSRKSGKPTGLATLLLHPRHNA